MAERKHRPVLLIYEALGKNDPDQVWRNFLQQTLSQNGVKLDTLNLAESNEDPFVKHRQYGYGRIIVESNTVKLLGERSQMTRLADKIQPPTQIVYLGDLETPEEMRKAIRLGVDRYMVALFRASYIMERLFGK